MMLVLSLGSLIVPYFCTALAGVSPDGTFTDEKLSRGIAIIFLLVYALYITFGQRTSRTVFEDSYLSLESESNLRRARERVMHTRDVESAVIQISWKAAAHPAVTSTDIVALESGRSHKEEPELSLVGSFMTLAIFTGLLGFHTEYLSNGLSYFQCQHFGFGFLGLTVLPLLSFDFGAVSEVIRDKEEVNIDSALGPSIQVAMLAAPRLVLVR